MTARWHRRQALASCCAALLAAGCVTAPPAERFLSADEDAEMRANCASGCVVVPAPVWLKIEQLLRALGAQGA